MCGTHSSPLPCPAPQSKFEVLEAEVKEINNNKETLKKNLLDLIELLQILMKTQVFFQEVGMATRMCDTVAIVDSEVFRHTCGCTGRVWCGWSFSQCRSK